jgi:hypothetical protein
VVEEAGIPGENHRPCTSSTVRSRNHKLSVMVIIN